MDRLSSMRVFLRVLEQGSLSAAARELKISPAGVSNHLRDLEEWLGTRLLNRTTRKLNLTEAGHGFRERCERILAEVAEAQSAAAYLKARPRGVLRVNAPVTFGIRHLGSAIADYLEQNREMRIDLVLNDSVVDFLEEGFDMAIRIGNLADSRLVARRLTLSRFVVCASPRYLNIHGTPIHPEELSAHHCLEYTLRTPSGCWLFKGANEEEVSVNVSGRLTATNGDLLREAAVRGLGITLAPTFIVAEDLQHGRLQALLREYTVKSTAVYAVHAAGRIPPPKLRSFIDFLASRFGPVPPWESCARTDFHARAIEPTWQVPDRASTI